MKRIATNRDGLYYRERRCKVDPSRLEKVWYGRFRDPGTNKRCEIVLGREISDSMEIFDAEKRLAGYVAGTEQTKAKKKLVAAETEAERLKNTLVGFWEMFACSTSRKGHRQCDLVIHKTDKVNFYKHVLPCLGDIHPQKITLEHFKKLKGEVFSKGLKPMTVKHVMMVLSRILRNGGIIIKKIPYPPVDNVTNEDLSPEELARVVKVLNNETGTYRRVADIMLLILCTACRQGEIRKLRWRDINFRLNKISIISPKGGKSFQISMNSKACDIIMRQPQPSGALARSDEYIFPGRNGKTLCTISTAAKKLIVKAGIEDPSFRACHGLRHVVLSDLARKLPLNVVREMAGHKSLKTTQRYLNNTEEQLKEAADILGGNIDV